MIETLLHSEAAAPATEPAASAMAFVLDDGSEAVMQRCFADIGIIDGRVARGSIDTATELLGRRAWPRLLVVDVSGIDDPIMRINRLADMCDPTTEVVVIGERNDIVLYRELKNAGVAEYFFKPLVASVVGRTLGAIAAGQPLSAGPRGGRLITVLGVRGGVGATTVAVNAVWHIAVVRQRRAVLLDLNLHNGDAALQLEAQPSHALCEALDQPGRIDDLFLERGIASVAMRLGLMAALEPLGNAAPLDETAAVEVVRALLVRYRYVFVDLPWWVAIGSPKLLRLSSTVLLVSTGSLASARDAARWREHLGPNTPDRSLLHILNKHGAEDALPQHELIRVLGDRPDVTIPFSREVAAATNLGAKAMHETAAMRRAMVSLLRMIAGDAITEPRPWWQRLFG